MKKLNCINCARKPPSGICCCLGFKPILELSHNWFHSSLRLPEGCVTKRVCNNKGCGKVEIINDVTGNWKQIVYNETKRQWEW